MLTRDEDAYGRLVHDRWRGRPATEIIERDDGWIAVSGGPAAYFAPFTRWPKHQRAAMRFVEGRVLDVGAGAGRASLYLQKRGHDVLAIDNSPLAVATCRLRGVTHTRVLAVTQISRRRLGEFQTILMLGGNFGLMANERRARWPLRRFDTLTSHAGRIVAEAADPYDTDEPAHRRYHCWNRRRGRMGGQTRIRVRYGEYRTPWFEYLRVSRAELRRLVRASPWRVERLIDSDGPAYIAVLRKRG